KLYLAIPSLHKFTCDQNQYSVQLIESPDEEDKEFGAMALYSEDASRDARFHFITHIDTLPYCLFEDVQFDENGLAYRKDVNPWRMCFNTSIGEVVHYWLVNE